MVYFKLPESLDKSLQTDSTRIVRHSVFTSSFWKSLQPGTEASRLLPILFIASFIMAFGQSSLYGAFPLFCREQLMLTASQVGMQYVWMGLIAVIIQGGLIKRLDKRFGERRLFFVGAILLSSGFGLVPLASNAMMLTLFLGVMSIGGSLIGPTLISLISKQSRPDQYGTILGASQGLSALGRAAGPTYGGLLYAYARPAPFFVTAVVLTSLIFIALKLAD